MSVASAGAGDIKRLLEVMVNFKDGGLSAGLQAANTQVASFKQGILAAAADTNTLTQGMQAAATMGGTFRATLEGIQGVLSGVKTGIFGLVGGFAALSIEAQRGESKQKAYTQAMSQMGIDGAKLLDSIRSSSKGLVSDVEILDRTNMAMMLIGKEAFEKTGGVAEGMSKMLRSAMASARATGQDLSYMFQSIVTGIARASPLWLDNLGIGIRATEAYDKYAKTLGKTSAALTMTEKKVALMNEVLRKGEENATRYGISSGGLKTQWEGMKVAVENLTFHLGLTFIPVMQKAVLALRELVLLADTYVVPVFKTVWQAFNNLPAPLTTFITLTAGLSLTLKPILGLLETVTGKEGPMARMVRWLGILAPGIVAVYSLLRDNKIVKDFIDQWKALEDPALFSRAGKDLAGSLGTALGEIRNDGTIAEELAGIKLDILSIFKSVGEGLQEVADGWMKSLTGGLDAKEIHSRVLRIVKSVHDLTEGAAYMGRAWIQAGKDGKTGLDRLGAAMSVTRKQYPELGKVIDKVAAFLDDLRKKVVAAKLWWKEHGDTVIMVARMIAGAIAGIGVAISLLTPTLAVLAGLKAAAIVLGVSFATAAGAISGITIALGIFGALYAANIGGFADMVNEMVFQVSQNLGQIPIMLGLVAAGFLAGGPLGAAIAFFVGAALMDFAGLRTRVLAELKAIYTAIVDGLFGEGTIARLEAWGNAFRTRWLHHWVQVTHDAEGKINAIGKAWAWLLRLMSMPLPGMAGPDGAGGGGDRSSSARTGTGLFAGLAAAADWGYEDAGFTLPTSGNAAGGPMDKEGEGEGDGKGGKGKKAGGDKKGGSGSKEDPIQKAFQAISTVSQAIQAAIGAMEAVWTKWRGKAPDALMQEVFDGMRSFVDRMALLASGVKLEALAGVQEYASLVSAAAGSVTAVIDTMNGLSRLRVPSVDRLTEVFSLVRWTAGLLFELQSTFAAGGKGAAIGMPGTGGGLESTVESLTLAKMLSESITAWAGSIKSVAEAVNAIAGARLDAPLAAAEATMRAMLDGAFGIAAYAKEKAGGSITPRTYLEAGDVATALQGWAKTYKDISETATAITRARWPSTYDNATAGLKALLAMAVTTTAELAAAYGDNLLIRLEDIGLVAEAIGGWPEVFKGVAEVATAVAGARWDATMAPLEEWAAGLLALARRLVDKLDHGTILLAADDLKVVADALGAWTAPLTALVGVAAAAEALAGMWVRGLRLSWAPMEAALLAVADMGGRLVVLARAALGSGLLTALEDSKAVAEALGAWVGLLTGLGGLMASLEASAVAARQTGTLEAMTILFGMLSEVAAGAGLLWSRAMKGMGSGYGNALDSSKQIAETFGVWIEMLSGLADLPVALGRVRDMSGLDAAMAAIFAVGDKDGKGGGILWRIAAGGWSFVAAIEKRAGAAAEQDLSQTIAGTFASWVGTLTGLGGLTTAIRRFGTGEDLTAAFDAIFAVPTAGGKGGVLWQIWAGGQAFVNTLVHRAGGRGELDLSQTIAATFASWIGVYEAAAGLTRTVRNAVLPSAERISDIQVTLWHIFRTMTDMPGMPGDLYSMGDPEGRAAEMQAAGDALNTWIEVYSGVAELGRKITQMTVPTGQQWARMGVVLHAMWTHMTDAANELVPSGGYFDRWKDDQLPRLTAVAEVTKLAADAFSAAAGLDLSRMVVPLAKEWAAAEASIREVVGRLEAITRDLVGDQLPLDVADWAARLQSVSEAVTAALEVFGAAGSLVLHGIMPPLVAEWSAAEDMMRQAMVHFQRLVGELAPQELLDDVKDWSERIKLVADAVGAAVGVIGDSLEALTALAGARAPTVDQGTIDSIFVGLRAVWAAAAGLFDEIFASGKGAMDPNRWQQQQRDRMELQSSFFDLLSQTVDMATTLGDWLSAVRTSPIRKLDPTELTGLTETIRDLWVMVAGLFDEMMPGAGAGQDPARVAADQDARLARMREFVGGVGDIAGVVGSLTGMLTGLHDAAGRLTTIGESTRQVLSSAVRDMVNMMADLADSFRFGTVEGARTVAQASEFAGMLGPILDTVGGITDTLLKLDSYIWEIVEPTGDARRTGPGPDGQKALRTSITAPHGPERRRRVVVVLREHVAQVMDTARIIFDEVRSAYVKFAADLKNENAALDPQTVASEVAAFAEKINGLSTMMQSMVGGIQAILESPLTALPFKVNSKTGIARFYSPFQLGVVQRRITGGGGIADQIKAGVKQAIRTMTEAVNEAMSDPSITMVPDEVRQRLALLSDAVHGLIRTITDINQMPDPDMAKIQKLVEAARLLAQIPWGALGGGVIGGGGIGLPGGGVIGGGGSGGPGGFTVGSTKVGPALKRLLGAALGGFDGLGAGGTGRPTNPFDGLGAGMGFSPAMAVALAGMASVSLVAGYDKGLKVKAHQTPVTIDNTINVDPPMVNVTVNVDPSGGSDSIIDGSPVTGRSSSDMIDSRSGRPKLSNQWQMAGGRYRDYVERQRNTVYRPRGV